MKKVMLLLALLIANVLCAQIKVKINDNLIAENTVIKADELKKFEIGFDKPKLLKDYGYGGEVTLEISYLKDGYYTNMLFFKKSGTNAIEAFLEEVNTFYILYEEGNPFKDFNGHSGFMTHLKYNQDETITLRISLFFREKIGYEKFGDPINLLKPFILKVDNKLFFENNNKAATEKTAQEQKENEEKTKNEKKPSTAGKVLKSIFGR